MYAQGEKISPINIADEMQKSFIDYSMSVIISRALPDARDGLKPSQRRILFAMHELGLAPNRPHRKCAKIAGDTSGNYHPHGEQVIYPTLVHMAQDFALRYPLIDGQGNFGSIDGDDPAAMRYTEARLSPIGMLMLADLDKDTVDFQPNYDETRREPKVLAAGFPNLICNGSTGIAVGMATSIPPHNLSEVVDACIHLIDNPECEVEAICKIITGPDFPTGGMICGKGPILDAYKTGRGTIKLRGRAGVEESGGKDQIIITQMPFNVAPSTVETQVASLVNDKRIEGISDIRNETNKDGVRLVIELKRGAIPKVILSNLFKHTSLETTIGINLLAIDHGRPRTLDIKQLLACHTEHRREVVIRRTQFELRAAEARAEILDAYLIALANLDEFIRIIRESRTREEAKIKLMSFSWTKAQVQHFGLHIRSEARLVSGRYEFSEKQVDQILDLRLYQLTGLERDKVTKEYKEIIARIGELTGVLASEAKIWGIVKKELKELKEKFGDTRLTDIVPEEGEIKIEDLIANEPAIITITHSGYIKRTAVSAYRAQRRGGKGVSGQDTKDDTDFVEHLFTASTHDFIMFSTENGRVYCEKVYDIPEAGRAARGKSIANLLALREGEKIAAMIRIQDFSDQLHLLFATQNGIIKKTNLSEFSNVRRGGIQGVNIEKDDRLIGVKLTNGNSEIVLVSRTGQSIRFHEEEARDMGRTATGVWGMDLDKDDLLVAIEIVDPQATLLVAGENGIGKRTEFEEYRRQSRGGKGIITMATSEKTGRVVGALSVTDTDEIMLTTAGGQTVRCRVKDVRTSGRNTQGVRLINPGSGDKLVAIARVITESQEAAAESGQPALPLAAQTPPPEEKK
ncbi:MAG: DNA gyrase subunit A [Verrucomicrobia bacterium]|nr:DNA gyrase subunit A [Verrucomicrobiota bacterium]